MARHEADREDLMREATALKRRIELHVPGEADTLIAGFRTGKFLSVYFGPDPAYHFDPAGGLRRAFVAGQLYRTQGTTLARLTRVRTSNATELQRHDLAPHELADFLDTMQQRLTHLANEIANRSVEVVEQVPNESPILEDLTVALARILATRAPLAPRIRGKR